VRGATVKIEKGCKAQLRQIIKSGKDESTAAEKGLKVEDKYTAPEKGLKSF
jgi:hypothetical protein